RDHVQRVESLEDDDEDDRDRAQAESDRRPGKQHHERDGKDEQALRRRAHSISSARLASISMPNGVSRPVTRPIKPPTDSSVSRPSPIGIDAYGIHRRARHMVSETHLLSHASFQKRNVSTVSVTAKARVTSAAKRARAKRSFRPA